MLSFWTVSIWMIPKHGHREAWFRVILIYNYMDELVIFNGAPRASHVHTTINPKIVLYGFASSSQSLNSDSFHNQFTQCHWQRITTNSSMRNTHRCLTLSPFLSKSCSSPIGSSIAGEAPIACCLWGSALLARSAIITK